MKKSIKLLVMLFSILIVTSCGETIDKINNSGLSNEDMQAVVSSANQFNAVLQQACET